MRKHNVSPLTKRIDTVLYYRFNDSHHAILRHLFKTFGGGCPITIYPTGLIDALIRS